jgi:hypothetical protein
VILHKMLYDVSDFPQTPMERRKQAAERLLQEDNV